MPAATWIRFTLLGHVSIQTTERHLGCKQSLHCAVSDRMGIEPKRTVDGNDGRDRSPLGAAARYKGVRA